MAETDVQWQVGSVGFGEWRGFGWMIDRIFRCCVMRLLRCFGFEGQRTGENGVVVTVKEVTSYVFAAAD